MDRMPGSQTFRPIASSSDPSSRLRLVPRMGEPAIFRRLGAEMAREGPEARGRAISMEMEGAGHETRDSWANKYAYPSIYLRRATVAEVVR